VKTILLCAGFATRLYPLTRNFPKPLLEVAGRPVLEDLVEQLIATRRVTAFQVISNARFYAHFEAWAAGLAARHPSIEFRVLNDGTLDNESRLGAVGDLALALEHEDPGDVALVAAGDNLFRFDLDAFVERATTSDRDWIAVYHERDLEKQRRTGIVEVDDQGRVVGFHEKSDAPPTDLASPALYILRRGALDEIPHFLSQHPGADAPGNFIAWLAQRRPVYVHEMRGGRLDVSNRESLERAEAWLREADARG
jgi:glucose-1-phosphate thymidylyltransferase